jgi:hypothetical protein
MFDSCDVGEHPLSGFMQKLIDVQLLEEASKLKRHIMVLIKKAAVAISYLDFLYIIRPM